MTRVSFLHSIHGQRANRISHLGVNGRRSHVAKNAVELRGIKLASLVLQRKPENLKCYQSMAARLQWFFL